MMNRHINIHQRTCIKHSNFSKLACGFETTRVCRSHWVHPLRWQHAYIHFLQSISNIFSLAVTTSHSLVFCEWKNCLLLETCHNSSGQDSESFSLLVVNTYPFFVVLCVHVSLTHLMCLVSIHICVFVSYTNSASQNGRSPNSRFSY